MEHIRKVTGKKGLLPPPTSLQPAASIYVGYGKRECPKCHGNGYLRKDLPVGHPDFGEARQCSRWTADTVPSLQENSGLTEARFKVRLADIVVEGRPGTARMLQACLEFCERSTGILTLWGGVGNGKTMALHGVVNELNGRGMQAVYVTAFALIAHIQGAFDSRHEVRSDSAYRRLRSFETFSVLALDELDKINPTKWVLDQLTDLIEVRYQLGEDETAGTLIAMNADPAQQSEWIASRLLDGRNRVVHNDDPDIRPALAR